ncbi:uncharacterized protein LOC101460263 [Ceratitis capitata]|uniref:uncharacterized protein LOC101460263 n=1 Tax=Ceratitis capitata TaxID=7213 RepID=UPI000329D68F|nr:uncharacterized protein LOC101460263 [Ceratitis capitata]
MPAFCAVQNCGDKYGHADNISFHKFPFKRQELMQKWLDFAQRGPDWQPSKWSSICSRHFREEDFNCAADRKILKKTAVPCLLEQKQTPATESVNNDQQHIEEISKAKVPDQGKTKPTTQVDTPNVEAFGETCEDFEEEEDQSLQATHSQSSPNVAKINCRLCGNACSLAVVSFSTNFEIYGMIQKCFPTLNIQKDDHLPKELCRQCLKRLESFSRFIDKVLETQSELQRKYRTEKPNNNTRFAERPLKVKQEPTVRVKQEVPEAYNSFLSDDLDMAMDEGCEQEPDADTNVEQKFDFCDFPMLNAQDIINNCDIMEIINLDDPFINIPDDDANTNCESNAQDEQQHEHNTHQRQQQSQSSMKRLLPSAHELLQAHLLSEEHNYAYTTEDLKEEWQFKNTYKTEKTDEGSEYGEQEELIANNEQEEDEQTGYTGEEQQNDGASDMYKENYVSSNIMDTNNTNGKQTSVDAPPLSSSLADTRSSRPIVTSVSALGETALALPNNADTNHNRNEKMMVTAVNDMRQHQQHEQQAQQSTSTDAAVNASTSVPTTHMAAAKPHTKPNIVVLDESIVKSSNAFQLHTCHTCHLKFFSMESLNQHYIVAHPLQTQLDQGAHLQKFSDSPMQQQQQQQQQLQHLRQPYNAEPQESLLTHNQHYQHQHQHEEQLPQQQQQQQQQQQEHLPMVSVPGNYMWKSYETANDGGNENFTQNCKIEKGYGSPATSAEGTHTHQPDESHTYLQPSIFGFTHSNPPRNTFITPNRSVEDATTLLGAPNAVRILEMKRTFLRQHELYSNIGNIPHDYDRATVHNNDEVKTNTYAAAANNMSVAENSSKTPAPLPTHQPPTAPLRMRKRKHSRQRARLNSRVIARLTALERKINAAASPDAVTTEYRHLRRRFKLLQRKCKSLEVQIMEKQVRGTKTITKPTTSQRSTTTRKTVALLRFCCRICQAKFKSIQRLLQHKRTHRHWARLHRMPKRFAATCCGCEKFFRHKIALRNHMRYICQALPLCWFKMQMKTFKCRYCRRSTFNHWRLYRRHEVKCKSARQRKTGKQSRPRAYHRNQSAAQKTQAQPLNHNKNDNAIAALRISSAAPVSATAPTPSKHKVPVTVGAREYACTVCAKVFASSNSLNQHSITHTDQRRHKCRLCDRAFKRRNGLTQHVRGFHLQLKPHQCTVCQRSYALKSDMLRCRHAAVKRVSGVLANKNQIADSVK